MIYSVISFPQFLGDIKSDSLITHLSMTGNKGETRNIKGEFNPSRYSISFGDGKKITHVCC